MFLQSFTYSLHYHTVQQEHKHQHIWLKWQIRQKKFYSTDPRSTLPSYHAFQVVEVVGRVKCGLSYFFFFSFSFSCKRDGRFFASAAAAASDALCSIHKNYPKVFARRSTWAVRPDWTIFKSFWAQIWLQKYLVQKIDDFWAILKMRLFK